MASWGMNGFREFEKGHKKGKNTVLYKLIKNTWLEYLEKEPKFILDIRCMYYGDFDLHST